MSDVINGTCLCGETSFAGNIPDDDVMPCCEKWRTQMSDTREVKRWSSCGIAAYLESKEGLDDDFISKKWIPESDYDAEHTKRLNLEKQLAEAQALTKRLSEQWDLERAQKVELKAENKRLKTPPMPSPPKDTFMTESGREISEKDFRP